MNKTMKLLAVLLAAQLLLALGLSFTGPDLSSRAGGAPLLTAEDESMADRLTIEGPDQSKTVLAKVDGSWRLPESGDFPADGERINQMLHRLATLKPGQPVATTEGALTRFKVSDKAFERRITLATGDKTLATIYLGDSPGMRQVHARRADQKEVYSVQFSTFEAPAKSEGWEDKGILAVPLEHIKGIEVAGLKLDLPAQPSKNETGASPAKKENKQDAGKPATVWQATGLAAGESLSPQAAGRLADLLAGLRIGSLLGKEAKPDYGLDTPVLDLTLVRDDGQRVEYQLGKMKAGADYALKVSSRAEYFRLPEYAAKPLIEAAMRETLLGAKPGAIKPAAGSTPEPKG
jgi:hypothetical protein